MLLEEADRIGLTSIIIPNYNGASILKPCIRSIKAHTKSPYEIIVVDNGSTDGSLEICYKERVKLISFANNRGFPAACNAGLRIALGDTLMLLNNDTLATPGWLAKMLTCLHSSNKVGMVGPMTNYALGHQKVKRHFKSIKEMAKAYSTPSDPSKWREVCRLVGFCLLFKKGMHDKIGYLDEAFSPGYYEDDDYCYRARRAGYRLLIAGDAFVYHMGSASFKRGDHKDKRRLLTANRKKFIEKWKVNPRIFIYKIKRVERHRK